MKSMCLIIVITAFALAQNGIGIRSDFDIVINVPNTMQYHGLPIIHPHVNFSSIDNSQIYLSFLTEQFTESILTDSDIEPGQIQIVSDSSSKKSRVERRQERKNRRLQELADKYTEEELREKIRQYHISRANGIVMMGVGIPVFVVGLAAYIVGRHNMYDTSKDGDNSDTEWAITTITGAIATGVGVALTGYGGIKTGKAGSSIRRFQKILDIKTDQISFKLDQRGLSFCYQF